MHRAWHLIWKIPLALTGVVLGVSILLVAGVAGVITSPYARHKVLDKGVEVANEKTDWDIDLGRLYLSPFHHSPKLLYRTWKEGETLPFRLEIDSLFVGHRGIDTLVYVQSLRLDALIKEATMANETGGRAINKDVLIEVNRLDLAQTVFHSDSLIPAVGVDVDLSSLHVSSPGLVFSKGLYPLDNLRLNDAVVGIDLRKPKTQPTTTPDKPQTPPPPPPLAFDINDGLLRNVHFSLTPVGLDIRTASLATDVMVNVGANDYDVHYLNVGDFALGIKDFKLPLDTIYGDAHVNLKRNLITSRGLHTRSQKIGAKADLRATSFSLKTMRVNVDADAEFRGSQARLKGYYDINDEAYDVTVNLLKTNLAPFLPENTHVALAGDIRAKGKGINPRSPAMRSKVNIHLPLCRYNELDASGLTLDASTDTATMLSLNTRGIAADIHSPMPAMKLAGKIQKLASARFRFLTPSGELDPAAFALLDTVHHLMPDMKASVRLEKGSVVQPLIDRTKVDIRDVNVLLVSDTARTNLSIDAATLDHTNDTSSHKSLRLPAADAALRLEMTEGMTVATLHAESQITDGAMTVHGLRTKTKLNLDLARADTTLNGNGVLTLDELFFNNMDLGSRSVNIQLAPSQRYVNALCTRVRLDDVPLELVDSILHMPDIELRGAVRAQATIDGLPAKTDISASVLPLGVSALYKPYSIELGLGKTPILMEHNRVNLNGLPIYGVDSTYLALTGGFDLNKMRLNVELEADSFAPMKMEQGGPLPVYGKAAVDIHGSVTGPMDSILADVTVSVLPSTDITYPIDEKNLAQVKPYGDVNIRYAMADTANALSLGGRINVDNGMVRYSPKLYPIMPFRVDSGSNVTFHGPIGKTRLDVSASQKVKADVQHENEPLQAVDFTTGVRVRGELDSVGLNSINFFLEAPKDEIITNEIAAADENMREGWAATLLATGMYMGDSNKASQRSGYALSSIINSRIDAAMTNSKRGKIIDVSVRAGESEHANLKSNDLNVAISKGFFDDKLRITLGATVAEIPEANNANGYYYNASADYRLTPKPAPADVFLRAFSQRDYNNILEGELTKSGIGVRANKEWTKTQYLAPSLSSVSAPEDSLSSLNVSVSSMDSIERVFSLTADADVAWRSNNSLGPNLTLTTSVRNLMGRGEVLSIKGNGAYYWALRNRHPGDPRKTDTYKLGVNTALVFPYLHWAGDDNPEGDTRYMLGYQYENIAGGYGVHKLTGSFTYFIRSPHNSFVTHAFTPFSLSVVNMKADSSVYDKASEFPQLIKLIAGNEFVPSVGYNFIYNDYRDKRPVNTMFEIGVKEAGFLVNSIYALFGKPWNDKDKKLGAITFNQFLKLTLELRNKFNITDRVCIATRLFAGANMPFGNSKNPPLSEAFYSGGANGMRAAAPYAYGPGNFYSPKYNQNFFHAGDVKLEANIELRFPIVWKLYGATFLDAGNVWNWSHTKDLLPAQDYQKLIETMQIKYDLYDGILANPDFLNQIALGTGAGLRLDIDGLVIRLDLGVAIHAPHPTYRYNKEGKPDYDQPITTYFNIPSGWDALRLNFGIGYPF